MRSHRPERIASVIRDIVSEAIARHLHDPRVSTLTSVSRVEVSRDLLSAKVYLTVPGNEADENKTVAALRHAAGRVQMLVARGLPIRQCPHLQFMIDPRVKGVRETMRLLDENRRAQPHLFEPDPAESEAQGSDAADSEQPSTGADGSDGVEA